MMPQRVTDALMCIGVLVFVVLGLLGAWGVLRVLTDGPRVPERTVCFEDEPCWDCATMGNQVCGSRP